MPQQPAIGADVTDLMPVGADVTDLMSRAEEATPAPRHQAAEFAAGIGEMLNPVEIAKGLYQIVRHPIDTATGLVRAQGEQFRKAANAPTASEAVGHGVAGLIPILGPIAANIGEQIGETGNVARGAGQTLGLLVGPKVAQQTFRGAKALVPTAKGLEHGAVSRLVDVMAPKVGPNKMRFGGMAEDVAPRLAKEPGMGAWSRQGFQNNVATKLDRAEAALDAAADARLNARSFPTQPIIDDLLSKRRELTAQTVEASQPARVTTTRTSPILDERGRPITITEQQAVPYGQDVVSGPAGVRVAQIDQAIGEIQALGPTARYEALRRIRQDYDQPAKAIYSPSMTTDYLKAQGGKLGAADVTGTLREALARMDPETAAANTEYSFWRKANDVLEATAEVERTRPKVGRQIAARVAGTFIGGGAAGVPGMVGGFVGGPIAESILSSGLTPKVQTARILSKLSSAIRQGNLNQVNSLTSQLQRPAAAGAGLVPILGTRRPPTEPPE